MVRAFSLVIFGLTGLVLLKPFCLSLFFSSRNFFTYNFEPSGSWTRSLSLPGLTSCSDLEKQQNKQTK